jgi:hypothetical protein
LLILQGKAGHHLPSSTEPYQIFLIAQSSRLLILLVELQHSKFQRGQALSQLNGNIEI